MYLARFELGPASLEVAGVELAGEPAGPLVPPAWIPLLLDAAAGDLAVRLRVRPERLEAALLLSGGDPDRLPARSIAQVAQALPPATGARLATSAGEFDRLTGGPPPHQLWLNQQGYSVAGRPVAADFRLLPLLPWIQTTLDGPGQDLTYQLNLRRSRPNPEETRTIRKYLAELRVDSPFPAPLTNLEATIASRLLTPGFLSDELVGTPDPRALTAIREAIETHFGETMGPFGFRAAPLEVGRFDDLFLSGCHSSRFGPAESFLARAAGLLHVDEVRRLLAGPPPLRPPAGGPTIAGAGAATVPPAPVFLSYSSKDAIEALATHRRLEAEGLGTWMAPGSIRPGESYPAAILRGIEACRVLVVLLSDASNLSPHVHREIERALHRNAVIVPLRLQDIQPTGAMEFLLSTCQWLDGFGPGFDPALDALVRRLRAVLGSG